MNRALIVYRRELAAYFNTPIATIVLALLVGLLALFFFKVAPFFATGRADMRFYFELMPVALLIFAPAVTMRLWSEEIRQGTAEILLTLPYRVWELVLGKFLAAYTLVVLALVLSAGVPMSIAWLGEPDWGPIVGGYVGTLLLGALFVALGAFVSSLTENQVVALLLGVVAGVFLVVVLRPEMVAYLLGSESALIPLVRALGVRSHFDGIERGVLAVADLVYFGSMTALFLLLNVFRVEARRYA